MQRQITIAAALAGLVVAALFSSPAAAQTNVFWQTAGTADWNDGGNWSSNVPPEAGFDEIGIINNGGTAQVSDTPLNAGGIILGQNAGESGALEVLSGGNLATAPFVDATGAIVVGQAGVGSLTVRSGGSLAGTSLAVGGEPGSDVRMVGPTAVLNISGGLTIGADASLTAEITAATHSPVLVSGAANLGGTLNVEFNGFSPTSGQYWSLVDAASVSGGFATIDTSAAPALSAGQQYVMRTTAGGVNGQLVQFGIEQLMSVTVDRGTGEVNFNNPSPTSSIDFDSYTLRSPGGHLSPVAWNSLHDQAISGWSEANPSAMALNELKSSGATTIAADSSLSLGAAWAPAPPDFGVPIEDLVFQYSRPDGTVFAIPVEYVGVGPATNNLVLTIDPATGMAQFNNDSALTIGLEGYTITSASGALLTSWSSLDDQNSDGGSWHEANPTAARLSELNGSGATTLASAAAFSLGELFDTGGDQDVVFEFLLEGESTLRQGVVRYETLALSPMPDLNMDGAVDIFDVAIVSNNWGAIGTPGSVAGDANKDGEVDIFDIALISNNWNPGGSATAVPEPTTWTIVCGTCLAWLAVGGRTARRRWPPLAQRTS